MSVSAFRSLLSTHILKDLVQRMLHCLSVPVTAVWLFYQNCSGIFRETQNGNEDFLLVDMFSLYVQLALVRV